MRQGASAPERTYGSRALTATGCTPTSGVNPADRHLHITRTAQHQYRLMPATFGLFGRVLQLQPAEAASWAQSINGARAAKHGATVSTGYLLAAVALHELMHAVIATATEPGGVYEGQFEASVEDLNLRLGAQSASKLAADFAAAYVAADADKLHVGSNDARPEAPERAALAEEILLLTLAAGNPALANVNDLFVLPGLMNTGSWQTAVQAIEERIGTPRPPGPPGAAGTAGGPEATSQPATDQSANASKSEPAIAKPLGAGQSLLELLLRPQKLKPSSLADQLEYATELWRPWLEKRFSRALEQARRAGDVLREEYVPPPGPPGPAAQHTAPHANYVALSDQENEAFSPDSDWMPNVALVAKSTYVWLAQLSQRFGYEIRTLDAIPDQVLAELSDQGFNSIWLIGLWWRSQASRTIKQLRGQPDAIGSAYSVRDYVVAPELGGDDALARLREKAARHGLRLASDMVPNHTSIDARWVVEHPDWYLQTDRPPYPSYTFTGPDLSADPRVSVRIEDHYYDGSDAAVVFQRVDQATGQARYIYHGNDGTALPWNDTAQLDFLNPDLRQAVIDTTVAVASRFPLVRLDAAMTLARRHVRRLWHPPPGEGGAIPSRSGLAASAEEFDQRMPQEFWRELVDALAQRAPNTMLLAEAFWMMEVYFVRTLGMHRVYNSAFMHMTYKEQNAQYRQYMKQYLAESPDVLGRFVNYMSNPDEESAAEQYGDGDKEFGVATLLATLPGLPMFGHGQVEGLREKYGMEFAAPRLNEQPLEWHIQRHQTQIAPLLKHRHLFASSQQFELYDLVQDGGGIAEDAYVYTNFAGGQHTLVAYNNSYSHVSGTVLSAAPVGLTGGGQRSRSLAQALGLDPNAGGEVVFEGLGASLSVAVDELVQQGLRLELEPYQALVYLSVSQQLPDQGEATGHRMRKQAGRQLNGAVLAGRRGVGRRRRVARRRR